MIHLMIMDFLAWNLTLLCSQHTRAFLASCLELDIFLPDLGIDVLCGSCVQRGGDCTIASDVNHSSQQWPKQRGSVRAGCSRAAGQRVRCRCVRPGSGRAGRQRAGRRHDRDRRDRRLLPGVRGGNDTDCDDAPLQNYSPRRWRKQERNQCLPAASRYPPIVIGRHPHPPARGLLARRRGSQSIQNPGRQSTSLWWRPMPYPYVNTPAELTQENSTSTSG